MSKEKSLDSELPDGKLDVLDRRLISELRGDPRLAYATLGSRLGVTGMTAANRLQRLRQGDLIRFKVSPNFGAQGLSTRIVGLLQADVSALDACVSALVASPYVLTADRVTGEYDLSFTAGFPSEEAMGALVRDLQSVPGVRRLVVHHVLATVKDDDGWSAIWAEPALVEDPTFEIAAGAVVPEHLRGHVVLAANWLNAFVAGEIGRLETLCSPDVTFTILPGQIGEGVYTGWPAVAEQSRIAGAIYRHLWHKIMAVHESNGAYSFMVDALHTAEWRKGRVRTAFVRMAFGIVDGQVTRVATLGRMELPDLPEAPHEVASTN